MQGTDGWLDALVDGGGERRLARVWGVLSREERQLVRVVLRAAEELANPGSLRRPPKTPDWRTSRGLTDAQWRAVKDLTPGALTACAIACALDRGQLRSIVMIDVGVFPRDARAREPSYVPDRVTIADCAIAVRGEVAIIALTDEYDVVRFDARDVPLGGLQDATGPTFLRALTHDLEAHVARPGTPLHALGLADVPIFVRRAPTLDAIGGRSGIANRVGVDQLPEIRRALERAGLRYLARLEDGRTPLMADLAPLERRGFRRLRTAGGPRVILQRDITRRLRSRHLAADGHRTPLDDYAFDGESYLGVYASGFGLPDEGGYFEPVAVAAYQTATPELYLISGWDLRSAEKRAELAAAVHFASLPELRGIIEDCRGRGRGSVDRHRPALRDPAADAMAAEIEHVYYALARLREIGLAHSSAPQ